MAPQPLLELTSGKRHTLRIDGEDYEISGVDDLDLELAVQLTSFEGMFKGDFPDPEQVGKLGRLCRRIVESQLDAPDAVKAKLTDFQRLKIIRAVFTLPAGDDLEPATPSSPNSPDSPASTEDTPSNG